MLAARVDATYEKGGGTVTLWQRARGHNCPEVTAADTDEVLHHVAQSWPDLPNTSATPSSRRSMPPPKTAE